MELWVCWMGWGKGNEYQLRNKPVDSPQPPFFASAATRGSILLMKRLNSFRDRRGYEYSI